MNLFEDLQWNSLMKIYICREKVKSLIFLNRLLHEVLGFAPTIKLTVFFCKADIITMLDDDRQEVCVCVYTHTHTQT
jgi:hypothetical protein